MAEQSARVEANLARERNENLQQAFVKKRTVSVFLTAGSLVAGVLAGIFQLPMLAFCCIVIALIFLVRYFDANSHLHEVRRRSCKTLAPDFSALKRKDQPSTSGQSQPLSQGS